MREAQRSVRAAAKKSASGGGGDEDNPYAEDPDREYKAAQSDEDKEAAGGGPKPKPKRKPGRPKGKAKPKKTENKEETEKKEEPKAAEIRKVRASLLLRQRARKSVGSHRWNPWLQSQSLQRHRRFRLKSQQQQSQVPGVSQRSARRSLKRDRECHARRQALCCTNRFR